jgi:hypothetical protein
MALLSCSGTASEEAAFPLGVLPIAHVQMLVMLSIVQLVHGFLPEGRTPLRCACGSCGRKAR